MRRFWSKTLVIQLQTRYESIPWLLYCSSTRNASNLAEDSVLVIRCQQPLVRVYCRDLGTMMIVSVSRYNILVLWIHTE